MSSEAQTSLNLRVQTVVYGNDPQRMTLWIRALADAVAHARPLLSRVEVAIADATAEPALDLAWRENAAELLTAGGVDDFELIATEHNLGHGGGQNLLLGDRVPDRLMVLNPDAMVAHDFLTHIIRASCAAGVGVVEGRQIPFEHSRAYDPKTGDTSWASGACMLVSGAVVSAVGLFDHDTFFMHGDDVDLSWRARQAGFRVTTCPEALVFHDKRLGPGAQWVAGEAEVYFSAHSALMLRWKYSRPDLVDETLRMLSESADQTVQRAVKDFEQRRSAGRLPGPIDPEHKCGQFVDGAYAPHRF